MSSSRGSHQKYTDPRVGKVLVAAFEEDEAGSHIGRVQVVASFAVVHNAAAAVAASSSSLQGHAAADHIGPFAGIEKKSGLSLLLRCTVPMDDGSQMWTAPSSLIERLPSVASRRLGVRLHSADASIPGETGLGRPIVRGKDA